jgi:uncharacterized protein involved in exopolysaccharide biosynthesis
MAELLDPHSEEEAGRMALKMIFASMLVAVVIGVVAAFILAGVQTPAYQAYSTSSTRVEPGHNLVGENWSGNPRPRGG